MTGARAQRGIDAAGRPRYVYEVKWAGVDPKTKEPFTNTYEPAACLIGWARFTPRLRVAHLVKPWPHAARCDNVNNNRK